tara:strand:+ start:810 stop:2144 length:1335 start_codon:yes stop_codon:yes gene_type:complete
MAYIKDTIAAIATPPGKGGVGIVRISGPEAARIGKEISKKETEPRVATLVSFYDSHNRTIDQGLLIRFIGPHSFTGEDLVELQGHGGPIVMDLLLKTAIQLGARQAGPGEFSQRAFLNEKIDLVQAEAIADLINSSSEQAALGSMRSLQGDFSHKINFILKELIQVRVLTEAAADFPEDDIEAEIDHDEKNILIRLLKELDELLNGAKEGEAFSKGVNLVLLGKPNAGKSSLMNALCRKDVSIVTDIPGTTRDVVREDALIEGITFRILDTAGIRKAENKIEMEGVKRARLEAERADITLNLVDLTEILSGQQMEEMEKKKRDRELVVYNKLDLIDDCHDLKNFLCVSVKTGQGLDTLKGRLIKKLGLVNSGDSMFSARRRHITAIESTRNHILKAINLIENKSQSDIFAEELRLAQIALDSITGAFSTDDLLEEIFNNFCIGK